jgi:tetratricopeptide (TPR) repeat protein
MFIYQSFRLRLIVTILLLLSATFPSQIEANPLNTNIALTFEESQKLSEEIEELLQQAKEAHKTRSMAVDFIKEALILAQKFEDYDKVYRTSDIITRFAEWGDLITALELWESFYPNFASDIYLLSSYDQTAANLVIKLVENGDIETARFWSNKISSVYPKAQALNAIATQLIKQEKTEAASVFLDEAIEVAEKITETYEANGSCANYRFEILSKIAANLSKLTQLKQALAIAETVEGCGSASGESGQDYQAESFLAILENTDNLTDLDQIWESSKNINREIEKAPVWSEIALKYIQVGKAKKAFKIAEKISKEIPTITEIDSGYAMRSVSIKPQALSKIALALNDAGYQEKALTVANFIEDVSSTLPEYYNYPNWREETIREINN